MTETVLGLRHGGGKILAVVDDRYSGHPEATPDYRPQLIEEMTPARARAVAKDLIRRADEVDPNSFGTTIWSLSPGQVEELSGALYWAAGEGRSIRLMIDGGVKVDVGDRTGWSLPYGTDVTRG